MYAFKVCISTLTALWMVLLLFGGLKAKGTGKTVALFGFVISALDMMAMWG